MSGLYTQCKAVTDRTGAHTCNRCGYQWDADDTAPPCKSWQQIKAEKHQRKRADRQASKRVGRNALKHIREELLK